MNVWLAVFLGGGTGSLVRYAISRAVLSLQLKSIFPWATLLSNLIACVLLAWLVLRMQVHQPGKEQWHALLAIGFCGGFSTLSTFSMENYALLRDGMYGMALLNVLVSVVLGVLLFHFIARTA